MFPDRLEIQLVVTFSPSDLNNRKSSYLFSSNSIRRLIVSIFVFFSYRLKFAVRLIGATLSRATFYLQGKKRDISELSRRNSSFHLWGRLRKLTNLTSLGFPRYMRGCGKHAMIMIVWLIKKTYDPIYGEKCSVYCWLYFMSVTC